MVDIFITTKGRQGTFFKSLRSFHKNTDQNLYRLTLVIDSDESDTESTLDMLWNERANIPVIDNRIIHNKNFGLGPSINQALAYIDSMKKWEGTEKRPFTLYLQDDIQYSPKWLETIIKKHMQYEKVFKPYSGLGFTTGIECKEHKVSAVLGDGCQFKEWIRATCMFARHEYWMSMWPISRIDPEHGRERGKPNDGLGSGVDWWFIRNHPNSVCRTNRTNLVIPGLLQHAGYAISTWLDRELPESDEDKLKLESF